MLWGPVGNKHCSWFNIWRKNGGWKMGAVAAARSGLLVWFGCPHTSGHIMYTLTIALLLVNNVLILYWAVFRHEKCNFVFIRLVKKWLQVPVQGFSLFSPFVPFQMFSVSLKRFLSHYKCVKSLASLCICFVSHCACFLCRCDHFVSVCRFKPLCSCFMFLCSYFVSL